MKLFLLLLTLQSPADSARVQKVRAQTDSIRKETCRGGTLSASGLTCSGAKYSTRVSVIRRLANRVDSIEKASLAAAEPTPTPTPTPTVAELPRTVPAYRDPYPGRLCSVTVAAGGDVTAALRAARGGAVICLATGGTYGPVTLPTRAAGDTGWIVLRTSGAWPAEGTRMTPTAAGPLAKVTVTGNATCAIETERKASGYFVRAFEVRAASTVTLTYDFVCLKLPDGGTYTTADVPERLVLAQLYVHGHSAQNVQNCIKVETAATAIVDSWLSDCHYAGVEAHGIHSFSSPGPLLVQNNHVQAQSINLLIGGATPRLTSGQPLTGLRTSDVTIRRNYFYTPAAWKGVWYPRKNHLELKNASRVLVEANVFDGSWEEASHGGVAIVLKSINDEGTCTWCQTSDVTVRWNQARNVAMGWGINGQECYASTGCSIWPPVATRIAFVENVFDLSNVEPYTGYGRGMQLGSGATDLLFDRNVISGTTGIMMMTFWEKPVDRVTFRDNVWAMGLYPLHVDPGGGYLADGVKTAVWERMTLVGTENPNRLPPSTVVASESQAPLAAQVRATVTTAVGGVIVPP